MSTFRNPVGPQPPQVYWRRRLLLGLGLVAVVVVIILIIVRPGSGTPAEPKASSSSSPKPTQTEAADGAACLPANLELTAITDKDSYGPGEQPQIGLSLKNTGAKACSINLGSTVQEFIILSGDEKYWDSKDCQTGAVDSEQVLAANQEVKTEPLIPWDRTRSSTSTCDAQRSPVTAGGASYHLEVKLGDLTSEKTKQFVLNG